jgi:hypothetical protein
MKKFSLIAALAIYSLGFSQEETKLEKIWGFYGHSKSINI